MWGECWPAAVQFESLLIVFQIVWAHRAWPQLCWQCWSGQIADTPSGERVRPALCKGFHTLGLLIKGKLFIKWVGCTEEWMEHNDCNFGLKWKCICLSFLSFFFFAWLTNEPWRDLQRKQQLPTCSWDLKLAVNLRSKYSENTVHLDSPKN